MLNPPTIAQQMNIGADDRRAARAGTQRQCLFAALVADHRRRSPNNNPYLPDDAPSSRPPSLMWASVMEKVLPAGGWTAAKNAGSLCDDFLVYVAGKTQECDRRQEPRGQAAGEGSAREDHAEARLQGCDLAARDPREQQEHDLSRPRPQQFGKFLLSEGVTAVQRGAAPADLQERVVSGGLGRGEEGSGEHRDQHQAAQVREGPRRRLSLEAPG